MHKILLEPARSARRSRGAAALLLAALALSGATTAFADKPRVVADDTRSGVVESIDKMERSKSSGVGGAIIGGVVGGVLGHQVGGGSGKYLATAAGAVGGAVAGRSIQRNRGQDAVYVVRVRMKDGSVRSFTQDSTEGLRVGKRVHIEDDDRLTRR
jgi:outer membrane lipoprotein SlyB